MTTTADAARGPRRPRRPTQAVLDRMALAYLARYAAPAERLRRVLLRKLERRCRLLGEDPAAFRGLVEEAVRKALSSGLVDDAAFAQARRASLRRRGASARAIEAKLAASGVDRATVAAALAEEDREEGDPEEAAALALARRRRIGPYRAGERRAFRDKDLAVLARAGYPLSLARRIVDGEPPE